MATIDENLLSLEEELNEMINETAALKERTGEYGDAKENLVSIHNRLESLIKCFEDLIRKDEKLVSAIKESAPDKIVASIDKASSVSEGLQKEVENLDEEFILVKDTMLEQFKGAEESISSSSNTTKKEIITVINELHEKYKLMADKVSVVNDKIVISQERILDVIKKQEEDRDKNKGEIQKSIIRLSNKLILSIIIIGVISIGLGITSLLIALR